MVEFRDSIIAGETLTACLRSTEASDVSVVFVGPEKKEFTFDQSGDHWKLEEDTAGWTAGRYRFEAWVTIDGRKSVCGRGAITVEKSLGDETTIPDARTTAEKNVDAIEAMLGGSANLSTKRYRINNRELEKYSIQELMQLLNYWKSERAKERRKAKGSNRLGPNINFRF